MAINNGYQLRLFRDVDFQENNPGEAHQRALQLMNSAAQFHKVSPAGDLEEAMKEHPSPHQFQFLMWTFMQQIDFMSEIRDQTLAEHD
ncbi:unnamed protein product [Penicillium camemberti]|uniref:Str. FM013 n=1 Tax=Penicillium camemberti (strain FM 013) TaxID=1429867 RepID=A0A0G4PTS1_PENC3|nr:unnamed protein product [Penicillium camemberti]